MAEHHQKEFSARSLMAEYQFIKIGNITAPEENSFAIDITLQESAKWECAIYIFVFNDAIIRIGSSKGRLGARMRQWGRDVTNALKRLPGSSASSSKTPEWEARVWQSLLQEHCKGEVYARVAASVTTPIGEFKAYMDEESILINRHKPPLNRHTNR